MERRQLEQQLLVQGAYQEVVAGLRLDNGLPVTAATGEQISDGQSVTIGRRPLNEAVAAGRYGAEPPEQIRQLDSYRQRG